MRLFVQGILSVGLLGACDTTYTTVARSCSVEIEAPIRTILENGEVFQIEGSPLTTHFDTAAYFGDQRATVLEVNRDSCEGCDACRDEAECNLCEDCDPCDALCDETCVETARIQVPEQMVGSTSLQLYNSFGQSNALALEIVHSPISDPAHPLDTASDSGLDSGDSDNDTAHATDSGNASDTGSDPDDSALPSQN